MVVYNKIVTWDFKSQFKISCTQLLYNMSAPVVCVQLILNCDIKSWDCFIVYNQIFIGIILCTVWHLSFSDWTKHVGVLIICSERKITITMASIPLESKMCAVTHVMSTVSAKLPAVYDKDDASYSGIVFVISAVSVYVMLWKYIFLARPIKCSWCWKQWIFILEQ